MRCPSCRGSGDIDEDISCLACGGTGEVPACNQWVVDDHLCDLPLDHAGPCAYQPPLFEAAGGSR